MTCVAAWGRYVVGVVTGEFGGVELQDSALSFGVCVAVGGRESVCSDESGA